MVIKKYLQKVFKKISYNFFLKIYGSINSSIKYNEDDRIKVKTINPGDEINYRVYKISNGRLYTDRIHDTAVILDNSIIEGPSFQLRYTHDLKMYNSKNFGLLEGYHQLGGTKMGIDKNNSVVDSDLKVHGVNNLYVSGSSNFVTSGYTNPTFTIVQMALKLSEHITKEVLH